MNKKKIKKSAAPQGPDPTDPDPRTAIEHESYPALLLPALTPENPEEYVPTTDELELIEQNRREVAVASSGDSRAEGNVGAEESKYQKRAFQLWYRQHLSGLFKAEQVDAAVARALEVEVGTVRRWKVLFGWSKRLETLKKEEKAEEKILLYAKNDAIEHESLNVLLKYLDHVKSIAPADILPHHVSMMMKFVDFSQKNKDKMDPPGATMNASGVSLTIHQD
jgi:hypothetical protein